MKRLLILTLLLCSTTILSAQKMLIGEKAPDLKVTEWVGEGTYSVGKATLIEFFHTSSKGCITRVDALDKMAKSYGKKMQVILLAKEPKATIQKSVDISKRSFLVAIDPTGKSFTLFGAQFVPYSVLIDKKGKIVWFGNPSALNDKLIMSAL